MSNTQTQRHWVGGAANFNAREQVTGVVRALSRARWRQIFIDCASTAVFSAVLVSIVAVAAIRFGWLSLSPWLAVFGLLFLALAGAAAIAFVRRPDDLDVAIDADLKLNLKQRLSTAWEFMSDDAHRESGSTGDCGPDDDDTVGRLATQAVRARLPARSRASQVFAARANAFALMTPVAVIALILVSIVDLDFARRTVTTDADEMVISEGVRLRNYGRRMQARAQQRDLPRSDEQSLRVRELGARMQSGALSRAQALSRLRDLDDDLDHARRDALNEGDQVDVGPLRTRTMNDSGQRRGMSARQLLQQLLDGRIRPADAASRMLDSDPSALSRRGISSAEMSEALQRFEAGDRKALENILDRMSRADQAIREANELNNAREQVARVRESLGDKNARRGDNQDSPASAAKNAKDGAPGDAERAALGALEDDIGEDGSSMPGGLSQNSKRKRERRTSNREPGIDEDGPQLKAQARILDGDVFVSEGQRQCRQHADRCAVHPTTGTGTVK